MKKLLSITFMFFFGLAIVTASNGEPTPLPINLEESSVSWTGYKIGGSHTGAVGLKSADIKMEDGVLTGGSFVIDMTSISCSDLDGEYAQKLVGHLSSDDFFGVATFPTATLEITRVVSRGVAGEYKVLADLTIKGKTNPIKFNVLTSEDGSLKADITVDRSEYDVKYGSGSFFDNLGDNTIYDEFEISVNLHSN